MPYIKGLNLRYLKMPIEITSSMDFSYAPRTGKLAHRTSSAMSQAITDARDQDRMLYEISPTWCTVFEGGEYVGYTTARSSTFTRIRDSESVIMADTDVCDMTVHDMVRLQHVAFYDNYSLHKAIELMG